MDLYNLFATHLVKLDKSIRYGLIQLVRNTPGKTGPEYQVKFLSKVDIQQFQEP